MVKSRFSFVSLIAPLRLLGALLIFVPVLALASERAEKSDDVLPSRLQLSYVVTKGGATVGRIEETFERQDGRYRAVSETKAQGILALFLKERIVLKSEGQVGTEGLKPDYFEQQRGDAKRSVKARFDWERGEIESLHDGMTENFALPKGTQDRLSLMYQFLFVPPKEDRLSVSLSQGKQAEQYRYVKKGEETVTTKAGSWLTWHFVREVREGENKAELWVSQSRPHLAVKVIFADKHGSLEQVLDSLNVQP